MAEQTAPQQVSAMDGPQDAASAAQPPPILVKHPLPQRLMHWFNAVFFFFLWFTGIALITSEGYRLAPRFYTDFVSGLFGSQTALLRAHIGAGIVWFAVVSLNFLIDPWGLALRFVRDLRWTKNDLGWFKVRVKHELDPKTELPPQGSYNAGQKAFGWTVILGVPSIGITGLLMVIGVGGHPVGSWMVFLHLIAVGLVIAFLIVHFSMAALIKEERPVLKAMFKGKVDPTYAEHHHQEWYQKVKARGGEPLDPAERFALPRAVWAVLRSRWKALASRPERPYWSPYLAGIGIGLAVLAAFLVFGHGLGASGLFSRIGAFGVATVAEDHVRGNAYWGPTLEEGFWGYWLLWMGIGTFVGGFISAALGGRLKAGVDRGELISPRLRIGLAIFGGALVGFATRFTRGCTSHQAISGGSLMATGSWVFMLSVFAGGFLAAIFLRRVWR
ncbi:MAG: cytochrome b/b6 domain-containing protein [Bradymonadales bacterium]|nr:cytochrome b/b6 domain-containing protein [Bradymonadales bacterium]